MKFGILLALSLGCLCMSGCSTIEKLKEVKEIADSSLTLNPEGVKSAINSVLTFDQLPKRYEINGASQNSECSEIQLIDNDKNVELTIIKAPLKDKSKTQADIASDFGQNGVTFKSAHSSKFLIGGLKDKKTGTIKVGGTQMSYEVGHIQKPHFKKDFVIPAFYGCVAGEKSYVIINAYESDGWMPGGPHSKIDYKKRVVKDFDLKDFELFLSHIKSFKLDN